MPIRICKGCGRITNSATNSLITKNTRDKWNKNTNKTIEEHLQDLAEGD